MLAEHVTWQDTFTVTVKVQVAVWFAGLVAVQVTVVTPTENEVPDAGEHVTVPPQLLVVVGAG